MGRKRTTNKHLPSRVYWKNGAYRLLTKTGRWIKLGANLSEMYQALSKIHSEPNNILTCAQLFDRYMQEIAPTKSKSSFKANLAQKKFLLEYFADMLVTDITPVDIYAYLDIRGKSGKIAANREFALLSHILTYAIRWGVTTQNPCAHVKKFPENGRSRNVTDAEYNAFLSFATYPLNYAIQLAYFMALRPTEVLSLKIENVLEEGFLIELTKTKKGVKRKLVQWTPGLKKVVDELIALNKIKCRNSSYLLCSKTGGQYTLDGFSSIWQRSMKKAIEKELLQEKFQFRDIRHKSATDMERQNGREAARKLLGHTTQNTTAKYIDGTSKVTALSNNIIQTP